MKSRILAVIGAAVLIGHSSSAYAISMLIGDVDGFGFYSPNTYENAQDGLPDVDGDGIIEPNEYLPDLDNDGHVWVNGHDEFDNRSASEAAATDGAQFTDISLEDYYNGFGDSPADDALFTFEFLVPELGDLDYGVDHFINFIFGDYDVSPAYLYVDGVQVNLTQQSSSDDGLVQLAYADVAWSYLTDGILVIDMYAPNEPYVAIDYAYLHTENTAAPVPAPGTLILLTTALAGMLVSRKKAA